MGNLKTRIKPLGIRNFNDIFACANLGVAKELKKFIEKKYIFSCPNCKCNKHIKKRGSNNGTPKYQCLNPNCKNCNLYFSATTSYEAIKLYQEKMIDTIIELTYANPTNWGTQQILETSKYFVEYALEALYKFISTNTQNTIKIKDGTDIVTIFFDLSGSKLSKNNAIILAKINDKIIFEIVSHSNSLSTYQLLASIKSKLKIPKTTQVVFVTDGEKCFVDSIRKHFPFSIHIRQFHGKNSKGIIYIHFVDENEIYTLRCFWNVVLKDGIPSKEVIKHRELKAKKKLLQKERVSSKGLPKYSEISKEIHLWKGIVYEPRGVRRLITNKSEKTETTDLLKKKLLNWEKVPAVLTVVN